MAKTNAIELTKDQYKGAPTTLCKGCGHNSITNHIVKAFKVGFSSSQAQFSLVPTRMKSGNPGSFLKGILLVSIHQLGGLQVALAAFF